MVDVWLGSVFGFGISQELESLLNTQGLSHAVGPLLRAGVKTMEDLGQMEEWQIDQLDLPIVSRRKLQVEAERARSQQGRPSPLNPQFAQQPHWQAAAPLPAPTAPPPSPGTLQKLVPDESHKDQPTWGVARPVRANPGEGWLEESAHGHPDAGTKWIV